MSAAYTSNEELNFSFLTKNWVKDSTEKCPKFLKRFKNNESKQYKRDVETQNIRKDENFSQKEFLNAIIHELKNPLNAIVGLSQILRNEEFYKVSLEERVDYLKDIDESANDLNEIIHDLLDVGIGGSNGDSFSVDLSEEIDIENVVRRVVKLNKDYAMRRGIAIDVEVAEGVSLIHLDLKRMKQILSNLISNSVKYSPEKTKIKIKIKDILIDGDRYLKIMVSDQGFGMTDEQIEQAFEKYKIIDNPNRKKVDSFGLGLPIVKKLVELQKGKIVVKSEPNKGTDFILKFPYMM